ncbi:UDP-N-acetylmuramyl tripeptide synthase [Clostridium pasteurianum BC1]|uniref:Lipid II isoglutaminyl synthase (glutamine-hydrolyzing) subunit MurT n=1 Tax=Clostridium pasteurianum BC1 TaxID=86416 RepID=R4KCH4_CLOPA|nr:UDP-N-acetylmuramyl tripeptide synthase [Clostridium pasteurianum BC1]
MGVFKIKINSFFSILISKVIIILSKKLFKGGTNFPGRVALKLDRNILNVVTKNYKVVLVTGTNGKTTTTNMIYNMLKESGKKVITNNTGANLKSGITSCFIDHFRFTKAKGNCYAVIEVDEANVKLITEYLIPEIIIITNLFRDQLDRYGEVYTTLNKIMDGVIKVPEATLVLNGDESLLGDLDVPNKTFYYGFNCSTNENKNVDINADAKFCKKCKNAYSYDFITYNHLGKFYCSKCGYKRPELTYHVDEIKELSTSGSLVCINNSEYYINQPGVYNIYNGLCALSTAKLLGIENSVIANSLKNIKSSFGRQEAININGKELKIILVKNPAGYDQALNTVSLDNRDINICILLNDNYADGRDVSWIWDVNFEILSKLNIKKTIVGGIRLYDIAVRLKIAGIDHNKFVIGENYEEILKNIEHCDGNIVYVLATYTAMIDFRKFLHTKGVIKKLW